MTSLITKENNLNGAPENALKQPVPAQNSLSKTSQFKVECLRLVLKELEAILNDIPFGNGQSVNGLKQIDIKKIDLKALKNQGPASDGGYFYINTATKMGFMSENGILCFKTNIDKISKEYNATVSDFALYSCPDNEWVEFQKELFSTVKVQKIHAEKILPLMRQLSEQSKDQNKTREAFVCKSILVGVISFIKILEKQDNAPLVYKLSRFNKLRAEITKKDPESPSSCQLIAAMVYLVTRQKCQEIINPNSNENFPELEWKWTNKEMAALKS